MAPALSWRGRQVRSPQPMVSQVGNRADGQAQPDRAPRGCSRGKCRPRPRPRRPGPAPAPAPPAPQRRPASRRAEPQGAARAGSRAPSVPFALLKEPGPHLGRGSRRWCRAALGETNRASKSILGSCTAQGPATRDEVGGVRHPRERGVAQPGSCPPTRSRPYSLASGEVEEQQEVARLVALYLWSVPPPAP